MYVSAFGHRVELDTAFLDAPAPVVERAVAAYLDGDRPTVDVPVRYPDSFTGDVMRAMAEIPRGETRTYGDLAADLDTAAVAVGQACGRNPVPLVVPCHRVVAADGLGGYSATGGLALKKQLLALEEV